MRVAFVCLSMWHGTIEELYKDYTISVLFKNQMGEIFPTAMGVCQGWNLSPVLFNMYLVNVRYSLLHVHRREATL